MSDNAQGDTYQKEFCDFCKRNFPEDDLRVVFTIQNGIEQREHTCPNCEEEARFIEAPVRTDGGTETNGISQCENPAEHYETHADDSKRGEKYLDDRTPLAAVYDGESLLAMLYKESEIERYQNNTIHEVVLTPAGDCRIRGVCRAAPPEVDLDV